MMRRTVFLILLSLVLASGVAAQSGGQLWVRAFDDRDGDGAHGPGEPLLTRGISVNLMNAEGVIIATALLDNSPNAAQGLVGFQLLPPGQYSVSVTSADFAPTGESTFTTTVQETGVPVVLEFAARSALVASEPTATPAAAVDEQMRLVVAVAGAAAAVLLMTVIGLVLYLGLLRPRLRNAMAADYRTTTGSMRPVHTGETGQMRTPTGEYRKP